MSAKTKSTTKKTAKTAKAADKKLETRKVGLADIINEMFEWQEAIGATITCLEWNNLRIEDDIHRYEQDLTGDVDAVDARCIREEISLGKSEVKDYKTVIKTLKLAANQLKVAQGY
jgi:hypothetical protein